MPPARLSVLCLALLIPNRVPTLVLLGLAVRYGRSCCVNSRLWKVDNRLRVNAQQVHHISIISPSQHMYCTQEDAVSSINNMPHQTCSTMTQRPHDMVPLRSLVGLGLGQPGSCRACMTIMIPYRRIHTTDIVRHHGYMLMLWTWTRRAGLC
jgi:hypothetical protein